MMNFTPLNIQNKAKPVENPISIQSIQGQNPPVKKINKIIKYKKLLKILKEGKYISARITAKALGIGKDTLLEYLKTPKAQQIAINEINESVQVMKKSEDWRSHDRLIQYAIGSDDKQGQSTGNNILIINNGKEYRIEENPA